MAVASRGKAITAAAASTFLLFVALLATVGYLSIRTGGHAEARLQLVEEVPKRSFTVMNAGSFRASPRLIRVVPLRTLYSASLGTDPQSFLQKAPEHGKRGMFG